MFCKNCGAELKEEARFCALCGAEVKINLEEAAISNQQEPKNKETSKVPTEKRKIDEIANRDFGGNVEMAIKECYKDNRLTCEMVKEFTLAESAVVLGCAKEEVDAKKGAGYFEKTLILNKELNDLHTTEEEILKATVNPYKSKILKLFLILIIAILAPMFSFIFKDIKFLAKIANIVIVAFPFISGCISLSIANYIMAYFKWRKLKKQIEKEKEMKDKEVLQ